MKSILKAIVSQAGFISTRGRNEPFRLSTTSTSRVEGIGRQDQFHTFKPPGAAEEDSYQFWVYSTENFTVVETDDGTVIYSSVQRSLLSEASNFYMFAQDTTFKVTEVGHARVVRESREEDARIAAANASTYSCPAQVGLPVKSVVFYGNSTVLFDQNNEIWKWNLINNDQQRVDVIHEVSDIVIPKSNNNYIAYLMTNGQVGTLYTSNLARRGLFTLLHLNDHMPHKIAVSANGQQLVAIANGNRYKKIRGRIQKWHLSRPMAAEYEGTDETERRVIRDIVLNSTGTTVLVADGDSNIDERGFKDGRIVGVYDPLIKNHRVTELATSGDLFASAHSGNYIYLWNWESKGVRELSASKSSAVSCLEFSKDGKYLAAGHENGEIHIWDASNGFLVNILTESPHAINDISFSDDGKYIAAGTGSYPIRDRNSYLHIWRRQ